MKKSYILLALMLIITSIGAQAQYSEARFRIYERGSNGNAFWPVEMLDSIAFVTDDYDLWSSATPKFNKDGTWALIVRASWAFSVKTPKVCVVPASYTEEEILTAYEKGTLSDVRTMNDSTYVTEYVLEDGTYKPVIFGFDQTGKMRNHYIGEQVNISGTYQTGVMNALMYGDSYTFNHYGWGYGSVMHIRDVMGEDFTHTGQIGYSHYSSWESNRNMGSDFRYSQFIWQYFDNAIQQLSKNIESLNVPGIQNNKIARHILGTAVAMRAMHYLDAARMYEYLPTDGTIPTNEHGNDVTNLTYPIGYAAEFAADSTAKAKRATREEMRAYIEEQLDWAEDLLENEQINDKELTNVSVVYGLKARLYMWVGEYAAARQYAEKALTGNNYQVLTEAQWHDVQTGFNNDQASSWMWAMKYKKNNEFVNSGICNWTSWCSNQTEFGYTGGATGLYVSIGASVYNGISDTDWRKKSFKAPQGSPLYGTESYPAGISPETIPALASLKFRPGQGNTADYTIGAAVDVPLMRIEEMHFIRMEAIANQGNWQEAQSILNTFMKENRDPNYNFSANSMEDIVNEIFNQKRIEFWGEGINYFDYKRLNKPVTRQYEGTNYVHNYQYNTTMRPAWMNFVFVNNAYKGAIEEWNNPDPSGCYQLF